jgi:hypothetical protein
MGRGSVDAGARVGRGMVRACGHAQHQHGCRWVAWQDVPGRGTEVVQAEVAQRDARLPASWYAGQPRCPVALLGESAQSFQRCASICVPSVRMRPGRARASARPLTCDHLSIAVADMSTGVARLRASLCFAHTALGLMRCVGPEGGLLASKSTKPLRLLPAARDTHTHAQHIHTPRALT